jgi:hypothetical protein
MCLAESINEDDLGFEGFTAGDGDDSSCLGLSKGESRDDFCSRDAVS